MNWISQSSLGLIFVGFVSACGGSANTVAGGFAGEIIAKSVSYTYQQADGNRVVNGAIDLVTSKRLSVPLDSAPKWLLSATDGTDTYWVAILDTGQIKAYRLAGDAISSVDVNPRTISPSVLPVLVIDSNNKLYIGNVVGGDLNGVGPTIYFGGQSDKRAFVDRDGNLLLQQNGKTSKLSLNVPTNARLLLDENERLLLLSTPTTTRYGHQVLGENSNMTRIMMVETKNKFEPILTIDIPDPKVVEGNALMWVDLDGDGQREIVTTISDSTRGAYIAVYDGATGAEIAKSADIGQGYRWRIQIAAAKFDQNRMEIFSVLFPHIGGILEFFRLDNGTLTSQSNNIGLTAHRNINQNVDMSLVGDFSSNQGTEAIVPSYDFTKWGVVSREGGEIKQIASIDIGHMMTSNPTAVNANGKLLVGVGYDGGFDIWY